MGAFARSIIFLARFIRRGVIALEGIRELYELDLASRGITRINKDLHDEMTISYGPAKEEELYR